MPQNINKHTKPMHWQIDCQAVIQILNDLSYVELKNFISICVYKGESISDVVHDSIRSYSLYYIKYYGYIIDHDKCLITGLPEAAYHYLKNKITKPDGKVTFCTSKEFLSQYYNTAVAEYDFHDKGVHPTDRLFDA